VNVEVVASFFTFCSVNAILLCSSGFYWAILGLYSGSTPYVDDQYTSIDAIHAAIIFTFGLLGILASLKVAFPASTVVSLFCVFIVAAGMSAEVAILFTLYPCSSFAATMETQARYFSSAQLLICSPTLPPPIANLGPWYGYCMLLIPLGSAWLGLLFLILAFVGWVKVDEFYFV
jgi:hypothetical protein